jgi:uncharacterized membrane protein
MFSLSQKRRLVKQILLLVCVAAVLACGPVWTANAETITYLALVADADTNWSTSVSVPMFNSSLGALGSVALIFNGLQQNLWVRMGE